MARHPVPRQAAPQPSNEAYRTIALTKGQFALVDADDYDYLMQFHWSAHWDPSINGYYARQGHGGPRMHNVIAGLYVDHKNRLGLDNRKENLRPCSHEENCRNRKLRADSRNGFKGAHLVGPNPKKKDRGGWIARIQIEGKRIALGRFKSAEEAAKAYDFAALCLFGEFALLNFDYSLPNVLPTP
jgi:hypothetical protein